MAVRMREVLVRQWVVVCVHLALSLHSNANEISSTCLSSINVFHDISKQIQQRTRIGEIFARWHLTIAITSISFISS